MKKNNLFHFKGVLHERETKEEKTKRIQMQFKKDYNAYMKKRQQALGVAIWEEIIK